MEEIKSNKNIWPWLLSGISLAMSTFAYIFFVYRNFVGLIFGAMDKSWFNIMFLYFLVALGLSITGLAIGIKRQQRGNRLSAALEIIIPILAILLTLFAGMGVELSIILSTT
ncbi:MAG: hypothetical protein HY764_01370 [Candidatus Portnoybacteria bacterium]|nr:hypothetical protein [Candidatus Portnoybacteria bacterium]